MTLPLVGPIAWHINFRTTYFVGIVPAIVLAVTEPVFMDTVGGEVAVAEVRVVQVSAVGHGTSDFVGIVFAVGVQVAAHRFQDALAVLAPEVLVFGTVTV